MNSPKETMLSDFVKISRQYQRSIRIDIDIGRPEALEGYICHGTAKAVLDSMSKQILNNNQRTFTWTGPFGGGKSSLAVALGCALGNDKRLRAKARQVLQLERLSEFDKAIPVRQGWITVPVVGKRGSVVAEIAKSLNRARGGSGEARKKSGASLIEELCETAAEKSNDGVFIVIDEMGKFLEACALGVGDDVYFFQELAEAAARSAGRLVVVGILHQSFSQYAARLGIDLRDDWAKIQGRYSDIPLVAASDEVVELIGKAIEAERRPDWMLKISKAIATSIQSRRPAVGENFAQILSQCWPLHPAMAALLGPISRRQFGQNERSTFGFLSSVEPHGFRWYLQNTPLSKATWYRPDDYWNYLRSNLEQAILASPDGHRWAQAVEAVERTEAKTSEKLHVELIKNIAIIDLFRNGSGLAAEFEVLSAIMYDQSKAKIQEALDQLAVWRVTLFKKHIGAWSVFEGSDFDIDAAVKQARSNLPGVDFDLLASLTNLYPVVAKRHYHETGTMRWMHMALCRLDAAEKLASNFKPKQGEFGLFLLALPSQGSNPKNYLKLCHEYTRESPWPIVIGVPNNHAKIVSLGAELIALESVQSRHELDGDPVARREIHARIYAVRANLEEQLRVAVACAKWVVGDLVFETGVRLSPIASSLADTLFADAPAIWSELINRDHPSPNSIKARKDLLYKMLGHEHEENLGIEGFPADRGLYETVLKMTELHRKDKLGLWSFQPPSEANSPSMASIWSATRDLFIDPGTRVSLATIHALWALPPFGVRQGVMPVLMVAFILAHKGNVAVYKDGIFIPHVSDADIDEYIQDPQRFSMRWILIDKEKTAILLGISAILAEVGMTIGARDPLEAARGLVALIFGLPAWSQRTLSLSAEARAVRDTLLKAHDPHKVLFVDLAAILENKAGISYVDALREPIKEISGAYDALLRRIENSMLEALDAPADKLDRLQFRAEALAGVTGDLRQDAFASRLAKHNGSRESVEGILSLAANKPPRDWNDRDIDAAMLEIAQASLRFRQTEAFVSVRGRVPTSEAFAVVIGAGSDTQIISRAFSIPDRHRAAVENMADILAHQLKSEGLSTNVLLAILAKAGMRLTTEDDTSMENSHG